MVIQHNLTAMNSNRQLNIMTGLQAKSSEKLSSGYRINRAADDAAGLAISEKMRRQVRGLSQASENVQDGISYVQVADGALNEIDTMLARLNELCVQASNDTLTSGDRKYIDSEVQHLKDEMNRTFRTTTFNNKLIWDENTTARKVVGHEKRVIFSSTLSTGNSKVTDQNKAAWPTDGFHFTANQDGTKVTVNWTGYDGVNYSSKEIDLPTDENLYNAFTIDLGAKMDTTKFPNAKDIKPTLTLSLDHEGDRNLLISTLNTTVISAYDDLYVSGTVYGDKVSGMYIDGGVIYDNDIFPYYAGLCTRNSICGNDNDHIQPLKGQDISNDNLVVDETTGNMTLKFKVGVNPNAKLGTQAVSTINATAKSAFGVYTTAYDKDNAEQEDIWWYYDNYNVKHERSQYFFGENLNKAIEKALDGTGKNSVLTNATVNGELIINFSLTPDSKVHYTGKDGEGKATSGAELTSLGSFYLHVPVTPGEKKESVLARIASITGIDLNTSGISSKSMSYYSGTKDFDVWGGTMALNIQAGSNGSDDNIIPIIYDVLNTYTLGLETLNTKKSADARSGLDQIKSAAQEVDKQRAIFGAYQNRMEHSYKNLTNAVENTQYAESVIRDTDMAAEMVKYANDNILAQAGQSMLAQANQTNQGVLSLLQ